MELYGLTQDQAQRIIEYVVQTRDGLIVESELLQKVRHTIGVEPYETEVAPGFTGTAWKPKAA